MDDNEKGFWFDMMPSVPDAQRQQLYEILKTEQEQLRKLNLKHQEEMKVLEEKYLKLKNM